VPGARPSSRAHSCSIKEIGGSRRDTVLKPRPGGRPSPTPSLPLPFRPVPPSCAHLSELCRHDRRHGPCEHLRHPAAARQPLSSLRVNDACKGRLELVHCVPQAGKAAAGSIKVDCGAATAAARCSIRERSCGSVARLTCPLDLSVAAVGGGETRGAVTSTNRLYVPHTHTHTHTTHTRARPPPHLSCQHERLRAQLNDPRDDGCDAAATSDGSNARRCSRCCPPPCRNGCSAATAALASGRTLPTCQWARLRLLLGMDVRQRRVAEAVKEKG
jgi:hypothetical protein